MDAAAISTPGAERLPSGALRKTSVGRNRLPPACSVSLPARATGPGVDATVAWSRASTEARNVERSAPPSRRTASTADS